MASEPPSGSSHPLGAGRPPPLRPLDVLVPFSLPLPLSAYMYVFGRLPIPTLSLRTHSSVLFSRPCGGLPFCCDTCICYRNFLPGSFHPTFFFHLFNLCQDQRASILLRYLNLNTWLGFPCLYPTFYFLSFFTLLPQDHLKDNEVVYVATDEKDRSLFEPFKKYTRVRFLSDYYERAGVSELNPNLLGMLDQVRYFWFSGLNGTGSVCCCCCCFKSCCCLCFGWRCCSVVDNVVVTSQRKWSPGLLSRPRMSVYPHRCNQEKLLP